MLRQRVATRGPGLFDGGQRITRREDSERWIMEVSTIVRRLSTTTRESVDSLWAVCEYLCVVRHRHNFGLVATAQRTPPRGRRRCLALSTSSGAQLSWRQRDGGIADASSQRPRPESGSIARTISSHACAVALTPWAIRWGVDDLGATHPPEFQVRHVRPASGKPLAFSRKAWARS